MLSSSILIILATIAGIVSLWRDELVEVKSVIADDETDKDKAKRLSDELKKEKTKRVKMWSTIILILTLIFTLYQIHQSKVSSDNANIAKQNQHSLDSSRYAKDSVNHIKDKLEDSIAYVQLDSTYRNSVENGKAVNNIRKASASILDSLDNVKAKIEAYSKEQINSLTKIASQSLDLIDAQKQISILQGKLNKNQEEVIKQQQENINYSTGSNSFCYLKADIEQKANHYYLYLNVVHQGKYPLQNIKIYIENVTKKVKEFKEVQSRQKAVSDKFAASSETDLNKLSFEMDSVSYNYRNLQADYTFKIDFLQPSQAPPTPENSNIIEMRYLGLEEIKKEDLQEFLTFDVTFEVRSGYYRQRIKLRDPYFNLLNTHAHWYDATVIISNPMGFNFQFVSPFYLKPFEKKENINWNSIDSF